MIWIVEAVGCIMVALVVALIVIWVIESFDR